MIKKIIYVVGFALLYILILSITVIIIVFIRQARIDNKINNDISTFIQNKSFQQAVNVDGLNVITQQVSCGYAVLQMFGDWCGTDVTEESLYEEYEKVVTSTGNLFCNEMNKQFPQFTTIMHKNCTNTELLSLIYNSLKDGNPVPFEFAAIYHDNNEDVWTLHYAIITGMDVANDSITVVNPYGYVEKYTIHNFLKATRFDSYENMPFYLKLAFAFGIFEKNTVFIVKDRDIGKLGGG